MSLGIDTLHLSEQLELSRRMEPQIKLARQEIFRLAKDAPDIEAMHWYMWLDECFENDEFYPKDFSTVRWRGWVLSEKEGHKVDYLLSLITPVLQAYGCVDNEGQTNSEYL